MNAFEERLSTAVAKAEAALQAAEVRLQVALKEYDTEVARHEERGDGFFSSGYIVARREAVLSRKHFEAKRSALSTAQAQQVAPRLEEL